MCSSKMLAQDSSDEAMFHGVAIEAVRTTIVSSISGFSSFNANRNKFRCQGSPSKTYSNQEADCHMTLTFSFEKHGLNVSINERHLRFGARNANEHVLRKKKSREIYPNA